MTVLRNLLLLLLAIFACLRSADADPSSAAQLAQELGSAQNDAEREALLASHRDVSPDEVFGILLGNSEQLRRQANYAAAQRAAEAGLFIAQKSGDQNKIADAFLQAGRVLYYHDEYDLARDYFSKCLAIREKSADTAAIAQVLTLIGKSLAQQKQYTPAREYYRKSLAVSEPAGNAKETAETLNASCFLEQNEQQYERAEENCEKSLALRRQIGEKGPIAESLMASGRIEYLLQKYDTAIGQFQESLKYFEELGDVYYSGYVRTCMGSVYLAEEDYIRALEAYEQGLATSSSINDLPTAASAVETIGEIHYAQGNFDVALDYFHKALDMFQKMNEPVYVAVVQEAIGKVYIHQGKAEQALEWLHRAMQEYQGLRSTRNIAYLHTQLGDLQMDQRNYEAAKASYSRALELANTPGARDIQGTALKDLAEVAYDQGRYADALDSGRRAAALGAEIKNNELQWQSLLTMGKALAATGKSSEARRVFDQSISILEDLRLKVAGGAEDRQRFLASRMAPYHTMIDFLVRQDKLAEAFVYAERARARVLVETLSGSRNDPQRFMTADEQAEDHKELDQMAEWNRRILEESGKENPDPKLLESCKEQLQKIRNEHEAFITNLYAVHPELRIQRGEIPSVTLRDARPLFQDAATALLEYVVMPDKTYLFVVYPDAPQPALEVRVFPIETSRIQLAAKVEDFRGKLASQNLDFSAASRSLYELLLKPAESLLGGRLNLLIVPDGELWNLPFAALRSPMNRYLLQDYVLVEVPSLAALREMGNTRRRASTAPTLFALGNPAAASGSARQFQRLYRDQQLGPLPDAEREVRLLAQIYGPSRSRIYVGKDATKDRFKSEAGRYQILHIATHGILNDASPLYSQLVLAPGTSPGSEDGLLEAWDIMNLKLQAQLAVLSACETGRGKVGSGEGMIGLSWAFLVAGVPTTVVSQWKVESRSTADLMIQFHRDLVSEEPASGFRVAAAFRRAALSMLKSPAYEHPFYWAGFFVLGAAN